MNAKQRIPLIACGYRIPNLNFDHIEKSVEEQGRFPLAKQNHTPGSHRPGEEVYGKQRFSPKGSFTSLPWAYNGKVFCLSEDGLTYVIKAGLEFEILETNPLDELCIATPSVVDEKLLVRTLTKVYCITNRESTAATELKQETLP